jgi:hypothetical protein
MGLLRDQPVIFELPNRENKFFGHLLRISYESALIYREAETRAVLRPLVKTKPRRRRRGSILSARLGRELGSRLQYIH